MQFIRRLNKIETPNNIHLLPFEELVKRFEPLIASLMKAAKKLHRGQIPDEDMRQELLLELYLATKRYDPIKNPNVYFSAYARRCLDYAMKYACRRYTDFYYEKNPNSDGYRMNNVSVIPIDYSGAEEFHNN